MAIPSPIIEQFVAYLKNTRAENTAQKYGQSAEKFLAFCAAHRRRVADLPPGILTLFSEYLTHSGLSAKSVHTHTAGAKKFLLWLQARGDIQNVPFTAPDLPKITRELPDALGESDIVTFLSIANEQREPQRTATMLLPFCGLRSDELTHLELGSIKRVDAPDQNGHQIPHICLSVRGKGGDMRVVPLLPDGRHILVAYLKRWRSRVPGGRWLFPMPDGSPISNRTLRYYVQGIRKSAQFKTGRDLTPHTLRRTYATTLHRAGVDIPTLTAIMGHKNVQTTVAHYLEIQPADLAGAVGRSGAALISNGPYADKVRAASADVSKFLSSLPNRSL